MSVYGYGNVGSGYRYPRRARKAVIAEPENGQEQLFTTKVLLKKTLGFNI
jgi:hypothetical protein